MECEKVKTLLPGYLDGGLHLDDGSESHLMIGRAPGSVRGMPRRAARLPDIVVVDVPRGARRAPC